MMGKTCEMSATGVDSSSATREAKHSLPSAKIWDITLYVAPRKCFNRTVYAWLNILWKPEL